MGEKNEIVIKKGGSHYQKKYDVIRLENEVGMNFFIELSKDNHTIDSKTSPIY